MKQFKRLDRWMMYYEKHIASPVSLEQFYNFTIMYWNFKLIFFFQLLAKHRSARGSLASKVKDVIAVVFSEFNLPPIPLINSNLRETEIKKWKRNPSVKGCFNRLFKKIKNIGPQTYMSWIIQTLRKRRKFLSKIQIAYAISVCEVLLNPHNLHIQVNESVIKPFLTKNLVSI